MKKQILFLLITLLLFGCSQPYSTTTTTTTDDIIQLTDGQIQGKLNIVNGASAECVMHNFFVTSDWMQIEGEIGRNGIDGLYIKKEDEIVKEVLVAESKWNSGSLGKSGVNKLIKQMSKDWILNTLNKLRDKNSDMDYKQIEKLVKNDQYRARLFKLIPKEDKLQILLYKLTNKGSNNFEMNKYNTIDNIDINKPKNTFEQILVTSYNDCRKTALVKYFPMLSSSDIEKLLLDNHLQKRDIKSVLGY